MLKKASGLYLILNVLISSLFVFAFYGQILLSPNSYQFSKSGDAIKNYYTYAYYIKNNDSDIEFEGLNYPYNEHFLYTDCTPILSFTLKKLNTFFPEISNYSVGILNFLLIISFISASLLFYLILSEFKVERWRAVIAGLLIVMLSPQVFRLTGHLALAFNFFFPLAWYLFIRYEKTKSLKYFMWLIISLLLIFYVHAYLGMIAASFIFAYTLVDAINDLRLKQFKIRKFLNPLLIVFSPIIIFRLFIFLTDSHTGRTDNPWGFFFAHADANSVFLPVKRPLKPLIDKLFIEYSPIWEGWAYIGMATVVLIVFYLYLSTIKSINKKKISFETKVFANKHLQFAAIAAILLLIFSTAYPFKFYQPSLDWVAVLKQFRAVGRFAWVFYYVVLVAVVYFIDRMVKLQKGNKSNMWKIIFLAFTLSTFYEAYPYHSDMTVKISDSPNLFDYKNLNQDLKTAIDDINPSDYQAIIPLPFFYIGSENFIKPGNDKVYLLTQLLSYHTKLPTFAAYLTRTSIWESKNIMQLMSPVFYHKEITGDIKSNRPLLLLYTKQKLSDYETNLKSRAVLVKDYGSFSLYKISKDNLLTFDNTTALSEFERNRDSLFRKNGFLVADTNQFLYYDGFDKSKSEISLSNGTAYKGKKKNYNILATFKGNTFKKGVKYVASFWMYNAGPNFGQDKLNSMFVLQTTLDKKSKWPLIVNPMYSQVIDGNWSLVEMEFSLDNPVVKTDFLLKGDGNSNVEITIDDFFIREKSSKNYRKIDNEGVLFFNNNLVKYGKSYKN